MGDLISRQAALDKLFKIKCNLQMMDDTFTADETMHGLRLAELMIKSLPDVAPDGKEGK